MNKIITISREFGSGGRELAKRLADELGYSYYDKEIITKIAQESDLNENYVQNVLNNDIITQFNFTFAHSFSNINYVNTSIEILNLQNKIIKELASTGNCVIVGRAADIILEEYKPFKIFVYADDVFKIERIRNREFNKEKLSDKEILKQINKIDKIRASNYDLISSNTWGDKSHYDLCINTSNIEIKKIIPSLAKYISGYFENK